MPGFDDQAEGSRPLEVNIELDGSYIDIHGAVTDHRSDVLSESTVSIADVLLVMLQAHSELGGTLPTALVIVVFETFAAAARAVFSGGVQESLKIEFKDALRFPIGGC